MNNNVDETSVAPYLSKVITFVFGGFIFVWFSEMMFLGIPALAKIHSSMWLVPIPENPQLELVNYVAWALGAPAKGALCVMAIIGFRSKNPSTRAILFACMSLVPPLNMLFPFRQQDFLLRPMMIATTLSTIIWGSFFLVREYARQPKPAKAQPSVQMPPTGWEKVQFGWFVLQSAALTLLALLFLFETRSALNLVFPSLTGLFNANEGALLGPIHSTLAAGTHILAVAIASWIATVKCRSNPSLRRAMTMASTVLAGLYIVFPLLQLAGEFGVSTAASSIIIAFVPLFVGWLLYAAGANRVEARKQPELSVQGATS